MTVGNIVTTIVLAIVGGSGFVGILFYFIRMYYNINFRFCNKKLNIFLFFY